MSTMAASEPRVHLVRGKSCNGGVIQLSAEDALLMGGVDSSTEFGVFFGEASDEQRLVSSLEHVLESFAVLAGRIIKNDEGLFIECTNAGVPLTFDTKDCRSPPQDVPYNVSFFDVARAASPSTDRPSGVGEAPLRVRVTTFNDGQLFALSFNHALGDAASFNIFLVSWGEAYRCTQIPAEVNHDRIGFFPVTPAGFADPPLEGDPPFEEQWLSLHQTAPPPTVVTADEPPSWSVVTWFRTFDELMELKKKYGSDSKGEVLSSVDVLTAEIVEKCRFEADDLRLHVVKQFRGELGDGRFFGNAFTVLGLNIPNSDAAPLMIRKAVAGCKSAAFIQWKLRQTHCGLELTGAHLMVNSWFRSMDPERIIFAGPADHVNFAVKTYQEEVSERNRTSPKADILPHRCGLRVNLFVRRSVALALTEAGSVSNCTDIDC